ncbi:serine/threonine-protein kinase SBK1-like [Bombina bombina]|uniref:serine/threonine-protein kinase SBK1-like n=1 Tax=Bombina bombina TaxID=8345 RepID=UPI00235AD4DC|nr:serine/threonine-protein kinase SBK1-like [Bombina bombina]
MASTILETTKTTANCILQLASLIAKYMVRMQITEQFDPIRHLGKGSYGNVLLAAHKESGKTVALKMLAKNMNRGENFLMEFATSLCLTSHPHIIGTYAVAFDTISHFVFVQEVATAGSLLSIIRPKFGLEEEIVKRCVLQLASALQFMHDKGFVHRDIKPDNILLMDRECHCIKLADFGLTQLQGTNVPSMSRVIPYMAPELCILGQNWGLLLHPSLDVWAFGVLIYIALTGSLPWYGAVACDDKYRTFVLWQNKKTPQVPTEWQMFTPEARQVFCRMLSLNPMERCSAWEVSAYVHLPWKVPSQSISGISTDTN